MHAQKWAFAALCALCIWRLGRWMPSWTRLLSKCRLGRYQAPTLRPLRIRCSSAPTASAAVSRDQSATLCASSSRSLPVASACGRCRGRRGHGPCVICMHAVCCSHPMHVSYTVDCSSTRAQAGTPGADRRSPLPAPGRLPTHAPPCPCHACFLPYAAWGLHNTRACRPCAYLGTGIHPHWQHYAGMGACRRASHAHVLPPGHLWPTPVPRTRHGQRRTPAPTWRAMSCSS